MDNQIPVPGGQIPPEQPSGTPSQQTPIKPSSNKGLIIGLVIAIIVALAAVIYLLTAKEAVSPSNGQAGNQNQVMDSRESILSVLQSDWAEFSNSFTVKPVLGATTWGYTGVQFISDDTFFIRFEDGHVGHLAIVQYQDNSLKLLELLESKLTLNRQEYEELLEQYGVPNYEVSNYTISIFRNGKIISFNTLTLAPENIILGENTESSWKTYRNEGYGFEVRIPSGWTVESLGSRNELIFYSQASREANQDRVAYCNKPEVQQRIETNEGNEAMECSMRNEDMYFVFMNMNILDGMGSKEVINGIEWSVTEGENSGWRFGAEKNGRFYIFKLPYLPENKNKMIEFLSTFKFINN